VTTDNKLKLIALIHSVAYTVSCYSMIALVLISNLIGVQEFFQGTVRFTY